MLHREPRQVTGHRDNRLGRMDLMATTDFRRLADPASDLTAMAIDADLQNGTESEDENPLLDQD